MSRLTLIYLIINCCAIDFNQAQTAGIKIDSLLIGTWNGSSICQIRNSPCHDEKVVYHITKDRGVDSFLINASKIVNGVEEEMGILPFVYSRKTNQIISTAHGIWTFNIKPGEIEGTLLVREELYRKIKLYKRY